MNPLMMLLGQQTGGAVDDENIREIVVSGSRRPPPVQEEIPNYDNMALNNEQAVINRATDIENTEKASTRSGMFGMKGTLRDVIGVLGDAFLMQSGRGPMYAPTRRNEQISDAGAGFSMGGQAARDASERVGYYDLDMGRKMLEEAENTEYKKAQLESLAASRQSLVEERAFKKYQRARDMIGALFNTPGAVVEGRINPDAIARAAQIAQSAGMTLEDFLINEGMTEQEVRDFATSVISSKDQERLEDYDRAGDQRDRSLDQRDYSNQTGRISATRPRAGRNPPQPTRASMLREIMAKPASQRTPEEQAFVTRETQPTGSGKGRGTTRAVPGAKKPSVSNW